MRRNKQELINNFKAFLGDNTSDEAISMLEDMQDSISDDTENWEQKYRENDEAWRKRYRDRFNGKQIKEEEDDDGGGNGMPQKLTYENLFKEDK